MTGDNNKPTLKQMRDFVSGVIKGVFPNRFTLKKISETEDGGSLLFNGKMIQGTGGGSTEAIGRSVETIWNAVDFAAHYTETGQYDAETWPDLPFVNLVEDEYVTLSKSLKDYDEIRFIYHRGVDAEFRDSEEGKPYSICEIGIVPFNYTVKDLLSGLNVAYEDQNSTYNGSNLSWFAVVRYYEELNQLRLIFRGGISLIRIEGIKYTEAILGRKVVPLFTNPVTSGGYTEYKDSYSIGAGINVGSTGTDFNVTLSENPNDYDETVMLMGLIITDGKHATQKIIIDSDVNNGIIEAVSNANYTHHCFEFTFNEKILTVKEKPLFGAVTTPGYATNTCVTLLKVYGIKYASVGMDANVSSSMIETATTETVTTLNTNTPSGTE